MATGALRVVATLRGRGATVALATSTIVFAAVPFSGWIAIPGALIAIWGIVLELRLRPTYSELVSARNESLKEARESSDALQSALDSLNRRLATHCRMNSTHQRISVYCHVGGEFVLLSRHSASTRLAAHGRRVYPADQGVIGVAWDLGFKVEMNWPDAEEDWIDVQKDQGIPDDVARSLRMRPRSMLGLRLEFAGVPVGVVVMESEQPRGVKRSTLELAGSSLLMESLSDILRSAAPRLPAVAEYVKSRESGAPS